ncbi:hypothetical protein ACNUDM_00390 [Vibrio chaetopteri]|uniref:hypothetical protein n=1 Tax=Vibrio chaetopteri TaxID=3016528 RepID=UPI003AB75CA6
MKRLIFYTYPLSALTFGLWQVTLICIYFSKFTFSRGKVSLVSLFWVCILGMVFIAQVYFSPQYPVELLSNVVNVELRSHGTIGIYYTDGSIRIDMLAKFFVYIFIALFISSSFTSKDELIDFLFKLFCTIAMVSMVFLVILQVDSSYEIFKFLSRQDVGVGNYLVKDEFGYRISAGFAEPSVMSVVAGTCAGLIFAKLEWKKRIVISLSLIFLFFVSRSLAIIIVFTLIYLILNHYRLFLIGMTIFMVLLTIVTTGFLFDSAFSFLFRSANERLFLPQGDFGYINVLFGVDFGQVYAFIPIVNHVLQFGVVGLVAFYFIFKFDVKLFLIYLVISFVSPQFWFPTQWICLGFAMAYKRLFVDFRSN